MNFCTRFGWDDLSSPQEMTFSNIQKLVTSENIKENVFLNLAQFSFTNILKSYLTRGILVMPRDCHVFCYQHIQQLKLGFLQLMRLFMFQIWRVRVHTGLHKIPEKPCRPCRCPHLTLPLSSPFLLNTAVRFLPPHDLPRGMLQLLFFISLYSITTAKMLAPWRTQERGTSMGILEPFLETFLLSLLQNYFLG